MTPSTAVLLAVLVLVVIAASLSQVAHRLDRLNLRVATAAETLRAARARRSAAALAVATSGSLDPATSVLLADAALRAADAQDDAPSVGPAESDLSAAIRAARESPPPTEIHPGPGTTPGAVDVTSEAVGGDAAGEVLAELDRAGARLSMARRLYNDAAAQCTQLHRARMVRWFHLAGHSAPPPTLDFDDEVPTIEPSVARVERSIPAPPRRGKGGS